HLRDTLRHPIRQADQRLLAAALVATDIDDDAVEAAEPLIDEQRDQILELRKSVAPSPDEDAEIGADDIDPYGRGFTLFRLNWRIEGADGGLQTHQIDEILGNLLRHGEKRRIVVHVTPGLVLVVRLRFALIAGSGALADIAGDGGACGARADPDEGFID